MNLHLYMVPVQNFLQWVSIIVFICLKCTLELWPLWANKSTHTLSAGPNYTPKEALSAVQKFYT